MADPDAATQIFGVSGGTHRGEWFGVPASGTRLVVRSMNSIGPSAAGSPTPGAWGAGLAGCIRSARSGRARRPRNEVCSYSRPSKPGWPPNLCCVATKGGAPTHIQTSRRTFRQSTNQPRSRRDFCLDPPASGAALLFCGGTSSHQRHTHHCVTCYYDIITSASPNIADWHFQLATPVIIGRH